MQAPPFETAIEQPLSLDVSGSGCFVVLDRGGRRLCVTGREPVDLDAPARVCRFHGENPVVAFDGGLIQTRDGERQAVAAKPLDMAVAPSGSVYLSYPDRIERVGDSPLQYEIEGGALAIESGGVWVAGTRALRLRPTPEGFQIREEHELPARARAAAIGPDGSLFVLLEPGNLLWRDGACVTLATELKDIARAPSQLLGCGPGGLFDLTGHVPPAEGAGPRFELPSCSS